MKTTKLTISTPSGKLFESDEVVILNADIINGRIGVMANHTPLVSSLKISTFSVEFKDGTKKDGVISGGIFNVTPKEIVMLTTDFDWVNEINFSEAENNIKNIKYQLQSNVSKAEEESLGERIKYNELKIEVFNR